MPPLSAVDQQLFDPTSPTHNLLIPGFYVSESADSNLDATPGTSSFQGLTRVLASLSLERAWKRQELSFDYVGGGFFASTNSIGASQGHEFGVADRLLWRSGQLTLHDSFSYLPEGSFGDVAFGGSGGLIGVGLPDTGFGPGIAGSSSSFFGPGQFASLGQEPRITNVAIGDIIQELSPRSSFTLAGSYGLAHFMDSGSVNNQGLSAINSQEETAQAGYDHELSRRDRIGIVYGFQDFRYPAPIDADFMTHLVNVLYGHQFSERLDFIVGGGPQATRVTGAQSNTNWTISGSGRASLRYQLSESSLTVEAERYDTAGSGILAGALSDVVRVTAAHAFGRKWSASIDVGYMRNSEILLAQSTTTPRGFNYVYAGGGLRRQIGRHFGIFASYQYNQQLLDNSVCTGSTLCGRTIQLHTALIGLDWHPNPFRID